MVDYKSPQLWCNAPECTMHQLGYRLCMVDFKPAQLWCNAPECTIHQLGYRLCMVDCKSAHFLCNAPYTMHHIPTLVHTLYCRLFKSAQFWYNAPCTMIYISWYYIYVQYPFIVHRFDW